jgi:APA family basic amino acid/polyamine antiporter
MENNNPSSSGSGVKLVQYFGLTTGIILLVSSIIGSGVYKKIAPMSLDLQSPELILLAWALAGVVTLFGVLTLAEIAMLIPVSGGPFAYLREIYGKPVSFFYGWASFSCIQTASTASISYVFAQSVHAVYPLPSLGGEWETMSVWGLFTPFASLGVKLTAVTLIAVLTFINSRGVHQGGKVSNVVTVIVLVSLLLIALFGISLSGGSLSHITQDAVTYPPDSFDQQGGFLKAMFLAMLAAFWAYEGWINIGFVGDEIRNPHRNIPRILIIGMLIITGIYLLVNFTYLFVMPVDEMMIVAQNTNNIAAVEVIRKFLGNGGAYAISLLIIVTTLGCTNATILTSGRIYYAMGKKGLFFRGAADVHPKYHTPNKALWMFAAWSIVLVFSGTFDQLTDMLVFAQFIFYALVVGGVFILRKKMADAPRPYKVIGYPVVPILYILFCIALITNTLIERPREAGLGLFLIALGTPFYLYFQRNNKHRNES